jgi:hypothetical protein
MEVDLAQGRGGDLGIVMIVISTYRVLATCICLRVGSGDLWIGSAQDSNGVCSKFTIFIDYV